MARLHQEVPDTSEIWKFALYKSGRSLTSQQAESTLRNLCEKHLQGRYTLEVIDIRVDIEAVPPDILAVPTVIRKFPNPERRVIGSLSESDKVVAGLGLDESLL
jgi:circadian clock protein KaiB